MTIECVVDALGAAEECLKCICQIIDIVDNEKGQTALHKAAAYQRSDICCLLVTAGASLLVKDNENRSARMLAMDSGAEQSLLTYLENQE